ncbi:MAG: hypothetical protein RLP15_01150 [Cryomorphaceae bacterium]
MRLHAFLIIAFFCSGATFAQGIIFVDAGNSGTQNGQSWSTAYADLQDALDAASTGDSLFIAAGEYHPSSNPYSSSNPRLNTFFFGGTNSLWVIGGFAGTETSFNQRADDSTSVHVSNRTLLSGDIGALNDSSDNAYHVVTVIGGGASLIFNGLTISHGNANDTTSLSIANTPVYNDYGGGLYSAASEHGMLDIVFMRNHAKRGGGAGYVTQTPSSNQDRNRFTDCTFFQNRLDHDASQDGQSGGAALLFHEYLGADVYNCSFLENKEVGSQGGGAIRCITSNPLVSHSTFKSNESSIGDGGGAVYCALESSPQFDTCTFWQNSTLDQGGAVYCDNSTPTFNECLFVENEGVSGAGAIEMDGESNAQFTSCTFSDNHTDNDGGAIQNWKSSPIFYKCTFLDNTAEGDGGGIFNYTDCSPWIANSWFEGNEAAGNGGALYNRRNSNPVVVNSVMIGNQAGGSGGGVYTLMSNSAPCSPVVTNSTITQNLAGTSGGGAFDDGEGDSKLRNSIVTGNLAPSGEDVEAPAALAATALGHSLVGNEYYEDGTSSPIIFTNAIFLDPINGDFRLAPNGEAIDMGDSSYFANNGTPDLSAYSLDLADMTRTMGDNTDLGAYESCGDTATTSASLVVGPNDTVDSGTVITFTSSLMNVGVVDSFAWKLNGTVLSQGTVDTLQLTAGVGIQDNDVVSFWYDAGVYCVAPDTGSSNAIAIHVTIPIDTTDTSNNDTTIGVAARVPAQMNLYPNPAMNHVMLEFGIIEKGRLLIRNSLGQVRFEQEISEKRRKLEVNTAAWPEGFYFIHFSTPNRSRYSILVIQR